MASLFVTDLHININESNLFKKFSSVGPIQSIHICRDAATKTSLGYAYVNFVERGHVEQAIETMNFDLMEGKPIRLMRSVKNPSLRKIGEPNVFVKNLHSDINNGSLYGVFSQFGRVLSCKVAEDRNGISKGYGFVVFEDEKSAMQSIEALDSSLLSGKVIRVERFTKRKIKDSESFRNLYIKNIGDDCNENMLKEIFGKYGKIISHKIMTEPNGISRGFGFVAFECSEAAKNAITALNGKILWNGKVLYVARAQTKGERRLQLKHEEDDLIDSRRKRNLFISNLDDTIDDFRLFEEFKGYGTILSAKVVKKYGRSIGFGFVCFSDSDAAEKAIAAMNGHIVGTKPLFVALAESIEHHRKTNLPITSSVDYFRNISTSSLPRSVVQETSSSSIHEPIKIYSNGKLANDESRGCEIQ